MAILHDLSDKDYWSLEAINASSLKTFINDPIEYQNRYIKKTLQYKKSDALDFGSALHCKILEPEDFENRFVVKPEGLSLVTKEGKQWKFEAGDKKVVSNDDLRLIDTLSRRAIEILPFGWLGGNHAKEIALTHEYMPNVWLKSKVDWLIELDDRVLNVDLKTIQSIDDRTILRNMKDFGYNTQVAFYDSIIQKNYNKPVESYLLFMAKTTGNCRIIDVTNFAKGAMHTTFKYLDDLILAKKNNRFISRYDDVSTLEIPEWF